MDDNTFRIEDGLFYVGDRCIRWARIIDNKDLLPGTIHEHCVRRVRVPFEAGYEMSIVWGSCTYSDNYDHSFYGRPFKSASCTAEIAMFDRNEHIMELVDGDTVMGYVTPEQVLEEIDRQGTPGLALSQFLAIGP